MRDESTLKALTQAKKFLFDLAQVPAVIITIPGNYAIEIIREAIMPEDVELWVTTWRLDMQLATTHDRKIRVWLKIKPVSRQKRRKASVFQSLHVPGIHD